MLNDSARAAILVPSTCLAMLDSRPPHVQDEASAGRPIGYSLRIISYKKKSLYATVVSISLPKKRKKITDNRFWCYHAVYPVASHNFCGLFLATGQTMSQTQTETYSENLGREGHKKKKKQKPNKKKKEKKGNESDLTPLSFPTLQPYQIKTSPLPPPHSTP